MELDCALQEIMCIENWMPNIKTKSLVILMSLISDTYLISFLDWFSSFFTVKEIRDYYTV